MASVGFTVKAVLLSDCISRARKTVKNRNESGSLLSVSEWEDRVEEKNKRAV